MLVASFVSGDEKQDMEEILQRADPSFKAQMATGEAREKSGKEAEPTFSIPSAMTQARKSRARSATSPSIRSA